MSHYDVYAVTGEFMGTFRYSHTQANLMRAAGYSLVDVSMAVVSH
jgi:hypothetical protein